MANMEEINGVYGGIKTTEIEIQEKNAIYSETKIYNNEELESLSNDNDFYSDNEITIENLNLPAKIGFWNKVKTSLFGGIKIGLTSYTQTIDNESEYNYHHENAWNKIKGFLFKEITIEKK